MAIIDSSEAKSLQKSKKSVRSQIEKGDIQSRLEQLKSCSVQGSVHRLPSMSGERIWSNVVSNLNDRVAAFVINAVQDVLPHKVNLMRWNKTDSRECPLCKRDQILLHVLDNCEVALKSNRYLWRHNSVLSIIHKYLECHKPSGWNLSVDLPCSDYHFPDGFNDMMQQPDIITWSNKHKQIVF